MEKNNAAPLLRLMVEDYLRARGSKLMADIALPSLTVNCRIFIKYYDLLG